MQKYQTIGLVLVALGTSTAIQAQDLVKDALASFPRQTVRLEYSHPSKLRTLPNYATLRQRYVGRQLEGLEASLSELGIHEDDVDELAMGWEPSAQGMEFFGLAAGRFSSKQVAAAAAARDLSATPLAGQPAYCLKAGLGGNCVVLFSESRGAFGSLAVLTTLVEARGGQGVSLNSNERFKKLVSEAPGNASVWGVVVGPAMADWLKSWMPGQGNLQLDWSRVFQPVEWLGYSVEPGEKVRLDLKMECATTEGAGSLRQLLEGVKLAQQLAWQNQNPNQPNPFEAMEVELKGRRILVNLITAYSALEGIAASGTP